MEYLIIFFVFQMCCLAVPFTPISAYADTWHLGRILCHLVPMSLGTSGKISLFLFKNFNSLSSSFIVYVSTLTSLAIAVDRYFVIVHPFRSRMRLGVCILLIIVIWIVGISISLPLAIYMRFDGTNCKVNNKREKKLFRFFFFVKSNRDIGHNILLDVFSIFHH